MTEQGIAVIILAVGSAIGSIIGALKGTAADTKADLTRQDMKDHETRTLAMINSNTDRIAAVHAAVNDSLDSAVQLLGKSTPTDPPPILYASAQQVLPLTSDNTALGTNAADGHGDNYAAH